MGGLSHGRRRRHLATLLRKGEGRHGQHHHICIRGGWRDSSSRGMVMGGLSHGRRRRHLATLLRKGEGRHGQHHHICIRGGWRDSSSRGKHKATAIAIACPAKTVDWRDSSSRGKHKATAIAIACPAKTVDFLRNRQFWQCTAGYEQNREPPGLSWPLCSGRGTDGRGTGECVLFRSTWFGS